MLSHTGLAMLTPDSIGTRQEHQYFRVIATGIAGYCGKMFFLSEGEYVLWVKNGRPYKGVIDGARPFQPPKQRPRTARARSRIVEDDMADDDM